MNNEIKKAIGNFVVTIKEEVCGDWEHTNVVFTAGSDVADEFFAIRNIIEENICNDIIDDIREMFEIYEYLDITSIEVTTSTGPQQNKYLNP